MFHLLYAYSKLMKYKTNVGCWVNVLFNVGILTLIYLHFQSWDIDVESTLIQHWDIDIDPTSECRPMLHQRWTNEQNDGQIFFFCSVRPTYCQSYSNFGPTKDCYLGR